jgi:hypothetical protein
MISVVRRLLRVAFTSASAISLLLLLVMLMAWSRSPVDLVRSTHFGRWIYLGVYGGSIRCDVYGTEPQLYERFGPSRSWNVSRVWVRHGNGISRVNSVVQIEAPVALAIGLWAVLPALWWLLVYRRHRRRKRWIIEQRCLICGYDLRATPDRCPECGASVPQALKPVG